MKVFYGETCRAGAGFDRSCCTAMAGRKIGQGGFVTRIRRKSDKARFSNNGTG